MIERCFDLVELYAKPMTDEERQNYINQELAEAGFQSDRLFWECDMKEGDGTGRVIAKRSAC